MSRLHAQDREWALFQVCFVFMLCVLGQAVAFSARMPGRAPDGRRAGRCLSRIASSRALAVRERQRRSRWQKERDPVLAVVRGAQIHSAFFIHRDVLVPTVCFQPHPWKERRGNGVPSCKSSAKHLVVRRRDAEGSCGWGDPFPR